jgi:outer membrane receptor protein involved in Fe transport
VDWLAGVYYAHDDNQAHDLSDAVDPATLVPAGLLIDDLYPTTFAEYAVFGDLTFKITDRFDIQVGGRQSENRQIYEETISGPLWALFGLPDPSYNPPEHSTDSAFTYLLTPRFRVSSDLMMYARFASGYRPGGPNPTCVLFPTPCQYAPDKTQNYEVGVKGAALDQLVSFDASLYYINWEDIQLQVADSTSGFIYYTNASKAKSQGVEVAAQVRPFTGFTLGGWVAWNDAKLTADLPPTGAFGVSGDRLPFSSRISGNLSLEQEWTLASGAGLFAGAAVSYVGERENNFPNTATAERLKLPSYVMSNLRAGLRQDMWTLSAFVNNVGDKRGALAYVPISPTGYSTSYIQPRSYGMSLAVTF